MHDGENCREIAPATQAAGSAPAPVTLSVEQKLQLTRLFEQVLAPMVVDGRLARIQKHGETWNAYVGKVWEDQRILRLALCVMVSAT